MGRISCVGGVDFWPGDWIRVWRVALGYQNEGYCVIRGNLAVGR